MILIPEKPFDIEEVCGIVKKRSYEGKGFSIIVAAEGAVPKEVEGYITKDTKKDALGHVMLGGIGEFLAKEIEKRTGVESRHVVLGHLQRGGSPTAHDRILATRYGVRAVELINEGKFGVMVALQGNKTVDMETYKVAEVFFG